MLEYEKVFDISITLGESSEPFPGDDPFERKILCAVENGDPAYVSTFSMSAHSGTHLDLPAHFFASEPTMEELPASRFILPAVVADCTECDVVGAGEINSSGAGAGEALLLRTRNSSSGLAGGGQYQDGYVHLSHEAAAACVELGLALLGIDYFSVDRYGNEDYPVHKILLGAGLMILERIDLLNVPAGRYTLIALPLKAQGAEASPVRAVLLAELIFPRQCQKHGRTTRKNPD